MDINKIAEDSLSIILPSLKLIIDGSLKDAGSDLWETIKKPFKLDDKDKKIINELERNPKDVKLKGKAELRLAQLLEENPDIAEELIKCVQIFREENESNGILNIKNSKNVVIAKDIHLQSGNFIVGDGNRYEK